MSWEARTCLPVRSENIKFESLWAELSGIMQIYLFRKKFNFGILTHLYRGGGGPIIIMRKLDKDFLKILSIFWLDPFCSFCGKYERYLPMEKGANFYEFNILEFFLRIIVSYIPRGINKKIVPWIESEFLACITHSYKQGNNKVSIPLWGGIPGATIFPSRGAPCCGGIPGCPGYPGGAGMMWLPGGGAA